jgi:isoleucyl-tRNA synthetase
MIKDMDNKKLYQDLVDNKVVTIKINKEIIRLTDVDFQLLEIDKEDVARTDIGEITLFLDKNLTPELEAEGFAREIVRRIQSMRKDLNLNVEDKISTQLKVNEDKKTAIKNWAGYIKNETRSKDLKFNDIPIGKLIKNWRIDDFTVEIGIDK